MRCLLLLPKAAADIENSALYYVEQADLDLGLRFYRATEETLAWILENPSCGSSREFLSPRLQGLRAWPVRGFQRHLVFYRESDEAVQVIRVLHGARDILNIFKSDE